jgi:hypothetical protein
LKNKFKIFDKKNSYIPTTLKSSWFLLAAFCWILGWGEDGYFHVPVVLDKVEAGYGVEAGDNEA